MIDKKFACIDLETGATSINAVIYSIGVAIAKPTEPFNVYQTNVNPASCLDYDGQTDENTLAWWAKQSQAAKDARDAEPKYPIEVALRILNGQLEEAEVDYTIGNSPCFDQAILLYYYEKVGLFPHSSLTFRNQLDVRTIKTIHPWVNDIIKRRLNIIEAHIAVNDAKAELDGFLAYINSVFSRGM